MTTFNHQAAAEHPVTNPATGECPNPSCPCHEWARREPTLTNGDKNALLDTVIKRVRDDLNDGKPLTEMKGAGFIDSEKDALARIGAEIDPTHFARILTAVRDTAKAVSVATVRAAIADVLDTGRVDEDGRQRAWLFLLREDDVETERRSEFVDMVIARVAELQAEPLLYDLVLLTKLRDAGAEYSRGYSDGWEDAMRDGQTARLLAQEGKR